MKIIRKTKYLYNDLDFEKLNKIFIEIRNRENIKYYIYSNLDFSTLINDKENKL